MSKERPILFSGPMVRALLEGRKTQTRRIVKNATGAFWDHRGYEPYVDGGQVRWRGGGLSETCAPRPSCPYGEPGDRLWVRETWAEFPSDGDYIYRASFDSHLDRRIATALTWRPSIHMPRWASRINLRVTSVRVERLQAITEEDARAEGVERTRFADGDDCDAYEPEGYAPPLSTYVGAFESLWNEINGERASWELNPWVWVVGFEVIP